MPLFKKKKKSKGKRKNPQKNRRGHGNETIEAEIGGMQGTRVRALVGEDPTCRGATKPVHHNY